MTVLPGSRPAAGRLAAAWALAALVAVAAGGPAAGSVSRDGPAPARAPVRAPAQAAPNRAAVVVDTGESVRQVCVSFSEPSISGLEALRRAEADPVLAEYGGRGTAVCSLCGVGCPAGDCFCDRSRFWAYWRAPAGAAAYAFSPVGAAATSVQDGDVEAWRWGTGGAPDLVPFAQVCPPAAAPAAPTTGPPPAAAPATTAVAVVGAPPAAPATTAAPPPTTAAPPPVGGPAAGAAVDAPATSGVGGGPAEHGDDGRGDDPGGGPADEGRGAEVSAGEPARSSPGEDAGMLEWAGFAAVAAALLGWRQWVRRARRRKEQIGRNLAEHAPPNAVG